MNDKRKINRWWYSEQQNSIKMMLSFCLINTTCHVFVNGRWCEYTEWTSTVDGKCNWPDAVLIAESETILPIMINGVIQKQEGLIILTEREHAFCVAVGSGWLARDKNETLYFYTDKPLRNNDTDSWYSPTENNWMKIYGICNKIFPEFNFIQWSDEPYSIEELLKMPVKESGE